MTSFAFRGMRLVSFGAGLAVCCGFAAQGVFAAETEAKMYECNQGGSITFSDQPCAGQERQVEVPYDQPGGNADRSAQESLQARENAANAVGQAAVLDAQIAAKEQEISGLRIERDARIAELRQQMLHGTESIDTNAWQASMVQQAEEVAQDYSTRIVNATNELDALKAQRASLGPPGMLNP